MGAETHSETEGNGSNRGGAVTLPVQMGVTTDPYEELDTPTAGENSQGQRLPHLRSYNIDVSWLVYIGTFFFSAVRQGICNYMTASGIASEHIALEALVKAVSTFGIMLSAFWAAQSLLGTRCRSQLIVFFTVWATVCYAGVFAISTRLASLTMIPNVLLALVIGMSWSKRGCFAFVLLMLTLTLQVMLTFIINALPLIQSSLPEAVQQFLVPALKTFYLGFVTEVLTLAWKKLYKRPANPMILTCILLMALVSAETMGVVGLLAAVDSDNIWTNAAIFCITTIVMETNSRNGILASFIFKLMGKKYRFSDAAHIFRWGKMWASYCWVCVFAGFVVPALILGLTVEDSNFTFLRWEPWALLGIYVVQQMVTDFVYVYTQHYIRPSQTLSQTASRCLVLGEATPFFGENEHVGDDGGLRSPKGAVAATEEFEPASFKLGPFTVSGEALLMFIFFEYTVSVWNNYVRDQFCIYGTFLPTEDGTCD